MSYNQTDFKEYPLREQPLKSRKEQREVVPVLPRITQRRQVIPNKCHSKPRPGYHPKKVGVLPLITLVAGLSLAGFGDNAYSPLTPEKRNDLPEWTSYDHRSAQVAVALGYNNRQIYTNAQMSGEGTITLSEILSFNASLALDISAYQNGYQTVSVMGGISKSWISSTSSFSLEEIAECKKELDKPAEFFLTGSIGYETDMDGFTPFASVSATTSIGEKNISAKADIGARINLSEK